MGNCLVTKLKGNVNNPNLMVLGEIVLEVSEVATPATDSRLIRLGQSENPNITITVDGGTMVSIEQVSNNNCIVHAKPKYQFTQMTSPTDSIKVVNNIADFNYSPNIISFNCGFKNAQDINSIANAQYLNNLQIFTIQASRKSHTGDISVFNNCPNLVLLSIVFTSIEGDIASIGSATKLQTVEVTGDQLVYGNLTELAQAQVAAGRTSGNLNLTCVEYNPNLTVDGTENLLGTYRITFDSSLAGGFSINQVS